MNDRLSCGHSPDKLRSGKCRECNRIYQRSQRIARRIQDRVEDGVTIMMTEVEARELSLRIKATAAESRNALERLQDLVEEAKRGAAHIALGYKSWRAYLAEVLAVEPIRLPADERRELVRFLTGEGMSTRQIAPIVGASKNTVARDARDEAVPFGTAEGPEPIDETYNPQPGPGPEPAPQPERPPAPTKYGPRRKHHQQIESISVALSGLAMAADDITEQDGSINKEEAARLAGDLTKSIRSLNRLKTHLKGISR